MAHRAGTGDQPIPGLITSRRNPAYRLKPRPKESGPQGSARDAGRNSTQTGSRRRRSPSHSRRSPPRDLEAEKQAREQKEEEDRVRREREEVEDQRRRKEEEEEQQRRWAEQEAKWAEERKQREEQRRLEVQRQAERQKKLKGAFAMTDELSDQEDEDQDRARELVERHRRKATTSSAPPQLGAPAGPPGVGATGTAGGFLPLPSAAAPALRDLGGGPLPPRPTEKDDAVRLRASLADPSAPRSHAPGEVAEHFRRLSEMKRRFRRAEFGGPDKRRDLSRSRSRDKYDSVWIRPGSRHS